MPGGAIDELSMMLGSMQSSIAEGIRQRKSIDEKLERLTDLIPIVADMRKDLDTEVMPIIEAFKAQGHRTAGIALGVGAGAGLGAPGLWTLVKGLLAGASR